MKIKGKTLVKPNIEIIVIPRGDGEDIIFKAEAILSMDKFEAACPAPKPQTKLLPGGKKVPDTESPKYKEELLQYGAKRFAWMVVESLSATEGLEWEKVDRDNPDTWVLWTEELKESGFSEMELSRVIQGVMDANCLNEEKIEAARARFFTGAQEAQES